MFTHTQKKDTADWPPMLTWRDVCSNTQLYAHARRCVQYAMESEGAAVLGKRMRE
jgi:hypothetical protein